MKTAPRFLLRLTAGLVTLIGWPAIHPVRAADADVVELPPLMVEEALKPLKWRYAEMPGFEILTICPDGMSRQFAENSHRLEQLIRLLVPAKFQTQMAVPTTHILFDGDSERTISPEVMQEMMQRERARGGDEPPPRADFPPARGRGVGSMIERRVRFMPNMRLVDRDATSVFVIVQDTAARVDFIFTPDRFAYYLERRTPALPPWLIEGLNGLYLTAKFPDDRIVFAPAKWMADSETKELLADTDFPRTLLPMAELFAVMRQERLKGAAASLRLWRAQTALFVRWALAAKGGVRKEGLWKFVERLEREPLSEELFRACFGLGYADVRDRLSDYLASAIREELTLKAVKLEPLPPLPFRPATDDEIGRIRGDWERLEIDHVKKRFPAVAPKYLEQARRTLQRGYERGTRDPRLLAVYGLCEADAGNPAKARELLEAAVRGRVVRPRAYLELALLRFGEWTNDKPEARLTGPQVADLLVLLEQGRTQAPPLPEIYTMIYEVWLRTDSTPTAADLTVIVEGARIFSELPTIVMRAVYLTANHGQVAVAQALIELGLNRAPDAAAAERYRAARAKLNAAAPGPARK